MNTCIVALPHGLNPVLARDLAFDLDGLTRLDIDCIMNLPQDPEQPPPLRASLTPCRLLARLFQSGNQNGADAERKRAIVEAGTLIVLAGIGRFDDDVWTPVIARLLEARTKAAAPAALVLTWTGLEPFFLPYETRAAELAANPQLTAELLPTLERTIPALAHLLRAARDGDNADSAPQTRIAALAVHKNGSGHPVLDIAFH
jgi:hypothetical protein